MGLFSAADATNPTNWKNCNEMHLTFILHIVRGSFLRALDRGNVVEYARLSGFGWCNKFSC